MEINKNNDFKYFTEKFDDFQILRYRVPGFEKLSLNKKILLYYLYQAALSGRDILWDQNYKHNLCIRKTLENIVATYNGNRNNEDFEKFMTYTKKVWFSNGIHHHYSTEKFIPDFSKDYFVELIKNSSSENLPLMDNESVEDLINKLTPIIFNKNIDNKRVNLDASKDLIKASANNFYEGISQAEAEKFYTDNTDVSDKEPVSAGMNSKLVKENGEIKEKVWKVNGMYSSAIEKIVFWLEKAIEVSESGKQKAALKKLVEFYKTGDLKTFDEYNKLWLKDTETDIDVINGFIEVYGDALGKKATFESVVSIRDEEATKKAKTISENAEWFEKHSPTQKEYKKENIKGVTAKAINAVVESGDCSPSTPIGINLPNADWLRAEYGSKSVSISNIVYAYDQISKNNGAIEEFAFDEEEIALSKKYSFLASNLHTDLHEIVGHGSGKLKAGVADPNTTLKNYSSTIEEARADLVALYFAFDDKLIKLGLMPCRDVGKAEYNSYIRGGLMTQLVRIKLGSVLEESHMRNRQIIAKWAYEKGLKDNVVEKKIKNNKTYFVINDYEKLRNIFGELLREVQRIKSEGDYEAAKNLVENYGVKIDKDLHKEVKSRWEKLKIPAYSGFIQPVLKPVLKDDKIVDVKILYLDNFTEQMMEYSREYSFLPVYN